MPYLKVVSLKDKFKSLTIILQICHYMINYWLFILSQTLCFSLLVLTLLTFNFKTYLLSSNIWVIIAAISCTKKIWFPFSGAALQYLNISIITAIDTRSIKMKIFCRHFANQKYSFPYVSEEKQKKNQK